LAENRRFSGVWRRAIKGSVIAELQGIEVVDVAPDCADEIAESVCAAIIELPWFYRRPLKTLAFIAALVSILFAMRNLDAVSPRSRRRVLAILNFAPGFGLFSKYVRALALLALFDARGVVIPGAARPVTE
jgi:hypothetical protein